MPISYLRQRRPRRGPARSESDRDRRDPEAALNREDPADLPPRESGPTESAERGHAPAPAQRPER